MTSLFRYPTLFTVCAVLLAFAGCKQPETVVVDRSPTPTAPADTASEQAKEDASFRVLPMGEYQPIHSLDPLFADNAASMRAVQLVYEGLVRLNARGDVVPALAENWEVSDDSLQYTFKLQSDIYYHDSNIFSTGVGRNLRAADVKYVFERMASSEVPPRAAQLFMEIQGFDAYYQEQRLVYNPEKRNLDGVKGITAPDQQTVVFQLENRDPQFLKKLATPLAVIYPREAVGSSVGNFSAVGTGPFTFQQRDSENTLVFSKFENYYNASAIEINRVDIRTNTSETQLFRSMSAGDLYLLPQLGPQLMQNILDDNGELLNSYADRYRLNRTEGKANYIMRYNPKASLGLDGAQAISGILSSDTTDYFSKFPGNIVTTDTAASADSDLDLSNLSGPLFSAFSDDPFVRTFLGNLSGSLSGIGTSLKMIEIQAPSRNTALFFTQDYPLIPDRSWQNYRPLFRFSVEQLALQRTEINGLAFNSYPWWFNLRNVTLPTADNLN